ncbi:MAG: phage tail tape measure protein [Kiritimatiellae bacterium]|nr:phage tail tape measure protein [Kiritimatiellia bacterium]
MSANANIRAGRAYVEVTAETSKLKKSLDSAQSQLKAFGKSCQGLGRDMMALGGALSLPFALAEKSFAGFDDKMRLVQAVTSSAGDAFESLTQTAQRLGRETSFTAQQVADAMIALGRMGFDPSEIEASISSVLNLSRATGTELAESADIAANSLRIFGLEAGKMTHVADILTATANGSAQTLTDLFEGLKMAGPQAAAAGENIGELCASLGIMANMGIKGSLAGTALRKAYVQFADVKVQNVLRDVGVEAVDANGNLRKMAEIMRDVAAATKKMPTAERLSFMKDVFDVRGMMSGLSLAGNIEELDKFLARLRDVSGQADETARAMDRGIGGSFRLFQSAVEGTMNAVGEALSSTLQPMVARITAAINTFTKWVEANRGLVTSIAATVASIGAFGAAMFTVGTASRVLSAGVGVVSTAISGISGAFAALCSRGVLVSNSFSLIAQAFSNYRNAAMPAMVGTSKLLAALNLPIDARAKQIAAGLVLMSNAETAAVAKSAIAAKFSAMAAALKGLNTATIAATVSAKAHAAAETLAGIATQAATAAHTAFAAVSGMLTASHAKAALTAGVAATANLALAATTKVVAAGYLMASAAATAFCAIPITWILIAIVGALVGLCAYMASATKHTAQLSDEMTKLRDKGDQLRATDQLRMERLQQLAEKEKLSNAEMEEAEKLTNQLQGRYGNLGIAIDRTANSISLAADAQDRFNEAMKAQAIHQIEAEIAEMRKNVRELDEENKSLCGFWVNTWNTITFRMGKSAKEIEANGEKISDTMKKIAEARERLAAIKGGDKDALTGGKTEKEKLEEKVTQGKSERSASADEAEKAAKKVAEIEKKLAREQRTELENEISDIRELRDEYKKLLETVLSYEKSKKQKDAEKIADLEGRLAEADAAAEKRIAIAEAKAKKKFDKEVKELQEGFDETAEDIARSRAEGETDRKVEATLKDDAAAGMKLLADLIGQSKLAAAQAKAEFDRAMAEATADNDVTDEEKDRIQKAQDAYALAERLVDKYAAKLRSAQEEVQKRAGAVKPQGAFYARAASALRGNQMEQRMLTATQEIEKHTKKAAELLKGMDGGGSMTFQ